VGPTLGRAPCDVPVITTLPNQPTTRNSVASTIPPEADGQTERVPEVEHVPGNPEDDWPQQNLRGKGA
jgi:hypothetical protein